MDESELIKMIDAAYAACRSENMFCPWCSGQVVAADNGKNEHHDEFCDLMKFKRWQMTRKVAERLIKRPILLNELIKSLDEKVEDWPSASLEQSRPD